MSSRVALALITLALAGCVGTPDDDIGAIDVPNGIPVLGAQRSSIAWGDEVGERGGECTASTCRSHTFTVAPGDGAPRVLTVAAKWPYENAEIGLDGSDPSFQFDVEGPGGVWLGEGQLGWLGSVLLLPDPTPGEYEVRVWGTRTGGSYEVGAVLAPVPSPTAPAADLLPDLITMPLSGLAIEYPDGPPFNSVTAPAWGPAASALGVHGCGADEWVEDQVQRCLRFSNGIANVGVGPVEVRLPVEDAVLNAVGRPEFLQRIFVSDGSFRDEPAGPAQFHAVHGHYHFEAFAQTTLYEFDLGTGVRGPKVVDGQKLGYCFIDVGVYAVDHAPIAEPSYTVDGCLVPAEEQAIVSGLAPGWFDLYWSDLSHQFIEITGVPDGVYELESIANVEGRLQEATLANNGASLILRLSGEEVEILAGE